MRGESEALAREPGGEKVCGMARSGPRAARPDRPSAALVEGDRDRVREVRSGPGGAAGVTVPQLESPLLAGHDHDPLREGPWGDAGGDAALLATALHRPQRETFYCLSKMHLKVLVLMDI